MIKPFAKLLTVGTFSLATVAPVAMASDAVQNWPERPVSWTVPFPPGGAMDVMARTLGDAMSRELGKPFVIENRSGAGGNIGAQHVANQRPDGYSMMITSIGMATNPHLYSKLSYDPIKDFEAVTLLGVVPNVLVVNAENKELDSVQAVIQVAKANPEKLTYASAGAGTSIHLAGASFTKLTGTDILHIPYRGSSPAVTDLLGGQVDMMFDSITSAKPYIESGKLRALGLTTTQPSVSLPELKPIAELGVAGYEVSPWFAVFVPAGTDPALVQKMRDALVNAMESDAVKERFALIGVEAVGSTPAQMTEYLKQETDRWGTLINEANIRID